MKLNLIGKNFKITNDIKEEAQKKFDRLDKYFDQAYEMDVRFSKEGNFYTVESTAFLNRGRILRSETTADTYLTAIDQNIDGLVRQIRKNKTKLMRNRQSRDSIKFENLEEDLKEPENTESNIVRRKEIHVKPMDEQEAILQMELLGHNFFVYLDSEDNEVRVIYKRKKGDYGQIIPYLD
ncbi:MAG: ribosome-associated translation inhibitor RaiA [Anaerococcus sp.]|nr:ribosome-associated translation inhibitor RaiA [Anaerococcus sp.]MDD7045041.1 ribosome-associated translation inhibitor RaiA [Peptoniphilaceae bacterium]MDY2918452.1 ribosome-associated translation inhibitor RaiA [Anaerococcus sp.]